MLAPLSEQWDAALRSGDPLTFPGYAARLSELDHESVTTGLVGTDADGYVLIQGDFDVIGGSMGLVHGEKVVRAFDRATERRLPVVVVTRSGGARMQEGMVSLIQLARTAAAVVRHGQAGLLSVSVHLSPTTGGVFASYGSLTDLRVAETGAVIGFAGPRVVEQVTGERPDDSSHNATSALAAHLVDAVVESEDLLAWVEVALGHRDSPLEVYRPPTLLQAVDAPSTASPAWAEVEAARRMGRPSGIHVAAAATTSWTELGLGTDPALRSGLATLGGRRVVVVAFDRYAGGGQPGPGGYRLAQRAIGLAGRLGLPVVTFVDTPGADPSPASENGGIAAEIARTHASLAAVPTATVSVCVGEGGSGGALALSSADRFLMQEHSIFSVIGPEGAAVILERDAARAPEVAASLRLTSADALDLGIIDAVVPDGVDATVAAVVSALDELAGQEAGTARRARADQATQRWLVEGPEPT